MAEEKLEQMMCDNQAKFNDANQNSGSDLRYANQPLETRLASMDKDLAEISSAIDGLDINISDYLGNKPRNEQVGYRALEDAFMMIGKKSYDFLGFFANIFWLPTYIRRKSKTEYDILDTACFGIFMSAIGGLCIGTEIGLATFFISAVTNSLSGSYECSRKKIIEECEKE